MYYFQLDIHPLNSQKLTCRIRTAFGGVQSSSLYLDTNMSCFTRHDVFINSGNYQKSCLYWVLKIFQPSFFSFSDWQIRFSSAFLR